MARSHLRYVVSDRAGNVVQNAAVEIFLRATTTPVSGMWTLASGGSASPNPLISNNQGEVSAWLDAAQSVTVRVSDNSDGAYYPSNPANPQSWTTFSEDVEVLPAPEDIGAPHAHPYEPSGSVATHAGLADPHPGYLTPVEGNAAYEPTGAVATHSALATGVHGVGASTVESDAGSTAKVAAEAAARAGADTLLAAPDYLVGTATGTLSNEIAVGTSPGGELGGTWAAPTVDASHSGSTHAATQTAAEATAAAALTAHTGDASDAHDASAVSVVPVGGIVGTDVQAVLAELDAEHSILVANAQADSYTLVLTDAGKVIEMTKATVSTLTVPPNSAVAFPVGTIIEVHQYGAGQVTIAPGSGVTLRSPGAKLKLTGQYSSASIRKRATDEWTCHGDLTT